MEDTCIYSPSLERLCKCSVLSLLFQHSRKESWHKYPKTLGFEKNDDTATLLWRGVHPDFYLCHKFMDGPLLKPNRITSPTQARVIHTIILTMSTKVILKFFYQIFLFDLSNCGYNHDLSEVLIHRILWVNVSRTCWILRLGICLWSFSLRGFEEIEKAYFHLWAHRKQALEFGSFNKYKFIKTWKTHSLFEFNFI